MHLFWPGSVLCARSRTPLPQGDDRSRNRLSVVREVARRASEPSARATSRVVPITPTSEKSHAREVARGTRATFRTRATLRALGARWSCDFSDGLREFASPDANFRKSPRRSLESHRFSDKSHDSRDFSPNWHHLAPAAPEHTRTHPNTPEHTRTRPNTPEHLKKHLEDTPTHHDTLEARLNDEIPGRSPRDFTFYRQDDPGGH